SSTSAVVAKPSQIAKEKGKKGGFNNNTEAPVVNVPGPGKDNDSVERRAPRYTPPPLPSNPLQELPTSKAPSAAPLPKKQEEKKKQEEEKKAPAVKDSVTIPGSPAPVPFCQMDGARILNFALNDANGKKWEKTKDGGRARVILLDFWHSQCRYCDTALPRVKALHRNYARYGLQVVGVACEKGTLEQQQAKV